MMGESAIKIADSTLTVRAWLSYLSLNAGVFFGFVCGKEITLNICNLYTLFVMLSIHSSFPCRILSNLLSHTLVRKTLEESGNEAQYTVTQCEWLVP